MGLIKIDPTPRAFNFAIYIINLVQRKKNNMEMYSKCMVNIFGLL
jgi:hypothetical protein